MSITVECPACDESFTVPESSAGKKVRCPECKAAVVVPDEEETPRPAKRKKARARDDDDRPKGRRKARAQEEDEDDEEEYDEPEEPKLKGTGPNIPAPVWIAYGVCVVAMLVGLVVAVMLVQSARARTEENQKIAAEKERAAKAPKPQAKGDE